MNSSGSRKLPAAVILAAGESSRMGSPKALLPYRGSTFLESLAWLLAGANLDPLLVVLGHESERIESAVALPNSARILISTDYKLGQLSSLQTAIRALGAPAPPGLLVAPVDHPCLSEEVLRALLGVFLAEDPIVVIPTFHDRRGHPVIFASRLFDELLAAPLDAGARAVVRRHTVRHVPVVDEGILADIDDPEQYQRWISAREASQS